MATFILRDETVRQRAAEFVAALSMGTLWEVTIKPHVKKRSLDQNALWHAMIGEVAKATGNSHDDVAEAVKQMFLPPRFVEVGGKTMEVRRSTTKLNTKEMTDLIDQLVAWAGSELGIALALPEER